MFNIKKSVYKISILYITKNYINALKLTPNLAKVLFIVIQL